MESGSCFTNSASLGRIGVFRFSLIRFQLSENFRCQRKFCAQTYNLGDQSFRFFDQRVTLHLDPREIAATFLHYASGIYPIVDSFGRVHGFENLHVNDASLLPDAPGVNPQAGIMAIADRNAAHFLA